MVTLRLGSSTMVCPPVLILMMGKLEYGNSGMAGEVAENERVQLDTLPATPVIKSVTHSFQVPFGFCPLFIAPIISNGRNVPEKGAMAVRTLLGEFPRKQVEEKFCEVVVPNRDANVIKDPSGASNLIPNHWPWCGKC
jgi:hypothetical protein